MLIKRSPDVTSSQAVQCRISTHLVCLDMAFPSTTQLQPLQCSALRGGGDVTSENINTLALAPVSHPGATVLEAGIQLAAISPLMIWRLMHV